MDMVTRRDKGCKNGSLYAVAITQNDLVANVEENGTKGGELRAMSYRRRRQAPTRMEDAICRDCTNN